MEGKLSVASNILKWGYAAAVVLFVLITMTLTACSEPPSRDQKRGHNEPHKAAQGEPRLSGGSSDIKAEPRIVSKENLVERDVNAYYDAAASGDYVYTYEHLSDIDQQALTREEWVQSNTNMRSDQGTYELTGIRKVTNDTYDVDLIVEGAPRTTQFVFDKEVNGYVHKLTAEETAMFEEFLASASASTSASASASPTDNGGSGTTVTVVEVVDGDTFDIDQSIQGMDRVRLIGVDTPEVYGGEEACGQEASDFTTQQLEGQQVTLEIGEDPEDPYGRLLAYVFVGNEFYNETLVSEGLADAVSYPPNTKYDARLAAAEVSAKTPACGGGSDASASSAASASASASSSASASTNPSDGGASSKLSNGVDDVNCSDLSGPVQVGPNDEDNLDADGDGTGCD